MSKSNPSMDFPKTPADALAFDIAKAFKDEIRLSLYRQICSAHNRNVIYRAFGECMETPEHKIRRTRRALFIYLIHKYEREK